MTQKTTSAQTTLKLNELELIAIEKGLELLQQAQIADRWSLNRLQEKINQIAIN